MSSKNHFIDIERNAYTNVGSKQTDPRWHADESPTSKLPPGRDLYGGDDQSHSHDEGPLTSEPNRDKTINGKTLAEKNPDCSSIQVFDAPKDG